MQTPIVLIGPMAAGKTTVAALLAARLNAVHIELDELRWDYYAEIGYDEAHAKKLREEHGFLAVYRYWKPFELHAVERVLADHPAGVISFGAGHSVYEDPALFERARQALAPYEHVILLIPCADPAAAAAILNERLEAQLNQWGETLSPETMGMNDHFVNHPSNAALAKHVVYTQGITPQETCEAIERLLRVTA